MGKVKYILTAGVLRSGGAFGLGTATSYLSSFRSLHNWQYEAVSLALLSVIFGLLSGGGSWEAVFRKEGPPPYSPIK